MPAFAPSAKDGNRRGGSAFFRKGGIERLMRDVRAAPYHPLQPKRQHQFSGRIALGLEPV